MQSLILAVVALSLFSIFLGSLALNGRLGMNVTPTLWGDFADGVFAHTTLLKVSDFEGGLITAIEVLDSVFFRPNILFMPLFPERQQIDPGKILKECLDFRIGIA